MLNFLLVGVGGGLGAMARYGVESATVRYFGALTFPFATFAVNLLGCLLIGIVVGLGSNGESLGEHAKLFLAVGFLGGFTTFSAFGF